jgi:hypothetical protein
MREDLGAPLSKRSSAKNSTDEGSLVGRRARRGNGMPCVEIRSCLPSLSLLSQVHKVLLGLYVAFSCDS